MNSGHGPVSFGHVEPDLTLISALRPVNESAQHNGTSMLHQTAQRGGDRPLCPRAAKTAPWGREVSPRRSVICARFAGYENARTRVAGGGRRTRSEDRYRIRSGGGFFQVPYVRHPRRAAEQQERRAQ